MNKKKNGFFILAAVIALAVSSYAGQAASPIEGSWLGTLKVSGLELRIVFNLKASPDGALTATLDSIDQGAKGIPVNAAAFADGKLTLEVKVIQGKYEGVLDAATGTIAGTWAQSGGTFPLDLKKLDKPLEVNRPQEPKRPFPYEEVEVAYANSTAGITLAGTLTLPRGGAPHPAVILISGSGAQDRDEMIFNHKPFLLLADHLTRLGVAVLRADDRGVGKSGGDLMRSTTDDLATDVEAAIAFLKSRPDIDGRRIGLIGHSEGGVIAPLVASRNADAAFIVMLAGTGLPGEDILLLQSALIARASGANEETIRADGDAVKKIYAVVKTEADPEAAEKKIRAAAEELYVSMSEERRKETGDKETWIKSLVAGVNNPWFRYFLTYDPRPALEKVRCPVLAVFGEKDLQVPADANLASIGEALRRGGNNRYRLEKMPGLNHLFQTATTGSPAEYGSIEETMSPTLLDLVGKWVLETAGK